MAENVNANIRVDLDTSAALASLQTLQTQISNFNRSIVQGNAQAAAAQKSMVSTLTAQISATKQFSTSMVNVESSVSRLGRSIDKNKLSLGEYFRYGAASSRMFGSIFRKEHNEIMALATDRVKRLQTQYIALGEAQNGVTRAMAVRPMHLFNADTAIGIQRQQLFNKLLHDGSTSILNWGKNTQWAGRQLMVGFTVPLTIFGGVAGQIFMDLERQVVNFRRVYGDAMTPAGETDQMVEEIQNLGKEFTKYGIAVKDTVALAGQVAAAGAQGDELVAATAQSTRLATLGMIEMDQAMTATMALQTAFKLNNEELAQSIDFLNAVENQTVLSLNDVSQAIPLVAPVIKGLGGDVQDLAIFLTAMREGGVNAAEGANALKSGLASLINPTKNAKEQLKKVGININEILSQNKGDIRAIVTEFGAALGELSKFERQQTLAKVFGKYQFARLGALFENISTQGSQAQRVVDLTGQSFEELNALAEKELSAIEESIGMKFTGAVERLKLAIAPIGEVFLRIATPIIDVVTKLLEKFNELSPGVKQFISVLVAGVGVVVPTVIMLIGLFGNFIGQAIKGFALFNNFFNRLRGGSKDLEYLTNEELDAAAAASSLEGKTTSLTSALNTQRAAIINLTRAYRNYSTAANAVSTNLPQAVRPLPAKGFARGGMVGGSGNKDTEPALLTPGEFVMNREATEKFGPVLDAMNRGNVSGYAKGSRMFTFGDRTFEAQSSRSSSAIQKLLQRLGDISEDQKTQLIHALEKLQATNDITKTSLQSALKEVGIEIRNLPSGMVDAHVFEQKQVSISGAEARRLAAASGSPITAEESLRKLDILDELEAAVPGSTRIMQRSDFVVGLPKEINQALKSGLSAGAFADAFESSGIQKWGKIIKMSGASAEDATPEFMLLERKIIELARNAELAGLKVGDVADKSRGIISFGDITNQAVAELKSAGHSMGIVEKSIDDLNGRFRTFQVGINSELIPALREAGYTIKEVSRVSRSGRSERGYEISGRGMSPTFFRGQSQRERAPGSYGNVTAINLSEYYDQGESAGQVTGRGAIDGLEKSTRSQSDSRESQRVANDVANGFENQLKARVGDIRKAGEILGSAGVEGVASGSSDIRQVLKQQLGVGPLVEEEQANLRETIKLRQAENREIQRRAQLLARQKGYGPDVARRIAAEQIAQERASAVAAAPAVKPTVKGPVVPEGAQMLPIVSAQLSEETEKNTKEMSKMRSAAKKMGGALTRGSIKMQGALFGLDGLVFGLSFMENSIGQFAQKIMPAVFGVQALTMMIPMLTNPMGIAVVAMGALAGALIYARTTIDNLARESARAGANIGKIANSKNIISEATGFKFPDAKDRLFRFTEEDRKAMSEFAGFYESESGKNFIQEMKNLSSEERYKKISFMLAQAVGSGMEPEKAKAFGQSIADQLGDALLNSSIARDFANQVFQSGSQALLDLEKERTKNAPLIGSQDRPNYTSGINVLSKPYDITGAGAENPFQAGAKTGGIVMGAGAIAALAATATGIGAAAAPFILLGSLIAGIGAAAIGTAQAFNEQAETTAKAAEALGFSIQTTQDLANIEAVLEEERANGLISYETYVGRMEDLNKQQKEQADYIKQIFSVGADSGALMQAMGDQLTLQGFNPEQISIVTEKFSADALAQQFFQKNFSELSDKQSEYVTQVFQKVMTGITPENAAQRLKDVQTTWTNIAQSMVDAMSNGAKDVTFDEAFNKENYKNWLQSNVMPNIPGGKSVVGKFGSEILAGNLASMDEDLKKIGTSANDVQVALNGFADPMLVTKILATKTSISDFGSVLFKLQDFKGLNVEKTFVAIQNAVDAGEFSSAASAMTAIASGISAMSEMKFDKDGFFKDPSKLLPDPEAFTSMMLDMGKKISDIPSLYRKAFNAADDILDKFGKDAITKLGNIKPKILPQILTNVLGTSVSDASGIASVLNSAFPDQLTPANITVLASLAGDPIAMALLKNPKAVAAAKEGKTFYEETAYVGSGLMTQKFDLPQWFVDAMSNMGETTGTYVPTTKDKPTGGGAKPESWLEQLVKEIEGTLQILPKELDKLKKRAGMDIPQQFIQLIGFGDEGLKRIAELLGLKGKDLKNLINKWIKKTTSEISQGIEDETEIGKQKQQAFSILVDEGIDVKQAEQIASNTDNAFLIIQAAAGKTKKSLDAVVQGFINLENASNINPNQKAIDALNDRIDLEKRAFDQAIEQVDDLVEAQQDRVNLIQEEIDALEELNSADQRLLRDKDRQIESYNRQINGIERLIEKEQDSINTLKEEDEVRNRRSSAISHDLEILSKLEEDVRKSYQDRIDALDRVAQLNDRILQQQKDQLNISQALSSGDIYEAARAAQEMSQNEAAFAQTQARQALTQGMENQIASLTTAGGLTREQAEKEIADIKEQSYQTSLRIQQIEDVIATKNKQIEGIKISIRDVEDEKLKIEDRIYDRETLILDIQNKRLEPAQKQYDQLVKQRDEMKKIFDIKIADMEKEVEALELGNDRINQINSLAAAWGEVGNAIAAANKALKDGETKLGRAPVRIPTESYDDWQAKLTKWFADKAALEATYNAAIGSAYSSGNSAMSSSAGTSASPYAIGGMGIQFRNMGGMIKKYMSGGSVGMDSVPAMLTPGEFVIRKAMVDKYGIPMFDSINQGSFSMPRYNTQTSGIGEVDMGAQNNTNVIAPMYNSYSVNVNVSNPSASADDIANRVMTKIKGINDMSIRRVNGY